ncbi:MAG: ArsR/SmtB family transcription factor [Flavobacteriia bacterium]|jgi:DNA-binding transcriptional ArsR family regulator
MGASKSEQFTTEQNDISQLFKALGHPARIAIIQHLMNTKSCICNDLVGILPLSQATISQHLRELKDVGIIKGTIEGTSVCYCLDSSVFETMIKTLNECIELDERSSKQCC